MFYEYDPGTDDYVEIKNPQFWKFTNDGKRVPYTDEDVSNPLIQPYNKEGTELIIKGNAAQPGKFVVKTVISNINNENNDNQAVSINNIMDNVSGMETEEMSRLRKKYLIPGSTISHIGNKDLVNNDLVFLYNYFQYILQFYKNKITEKMGNAAFRNAMKDKLSYVNVFKNDIPAVKDFRDFFREDFKTYSEIADRYPVLDLKNRQVFSNPAKMYDKILELQVDLNNYHSLLERQIQQSKAFLNKINERLRSKKRRRGADNNQEFAPPKKLTFTLPKFAEGGKEKKRKTRKNKRS
jgi:hypothetical protein